MPRYVDEFLLAVRRDFPRVIVGGVEGPDVIAETRRIPGWNGDLSRLMLSTLLVFTTTIL